MRWTSAAFVLCLAATISAVGLSHLIRRTTDHSMAPPHDIIDAAGLTPNAEELDESDLEFVGFERIADVTYGPHGWRNQLDLYLPNEAPRPLPVIVYFHGGGASSSSKDVPAPRSWAPPLIARGYAYAQINYRVFGVDYAQKNTHGDVAARFPAQIHDGKTAIRFLRANASRYGIAPGRFGVLGFSFGGYLAALVGTTGNSRDFEQDGLYPNQSSEVQAACVVSGIYDFASHLHQWRLHFSALGYREPPADFVSATARGLFGDARRDLAFLRDVSPLAYADQGDPPFLIIHGFRDAICPPHQADMLYVRLRNANVKASLNLIPGANHTGSTILHKRNRTSIADFFDQYLKSDRRETARQSRPTISARSANVNLISASRVSACAT